MLFSLTKIPKILLGLVLGFWIFFLISPSLAQSSQANQGYVPPAKDRKQQKATASGSRGCSSQPIEIVPLIPTDHIGTTVSNQPNFLFFVKFTPHLPVSFTLVEPGVVEPLWEDRIIIERSGILSVSVPQRVNLDIGKTYVWNLEVVCSIDRPSENWYIRAAIKKVPLTTQLKQKLSEANSKSEKALILANNGIWYDAITVSYEARDNSISYSFFKQLLTQIGLSLPRLH